MPIDFGNIQGNIVDSTGKGPGAVSAPSNQGNLVVSGGPHSDGPRQYEREFTPSPIVTGKLYFLEYFQNQ